MDFDFYRLENGVRVILVPMQGVESLAIGVYVGAGSREETWETSGLAHFLEHMVFKGTQKFPTRVQTSILEGYGAIQNGYTYSEAAAYWGKMPADKWKLGLEVQKELALNPLLRVGDLTKERRVILEEIHHHDDTPEDKVWEVFYHMRYPSQSLGWSTLGRPEVIRTIPIANFRQFHTEHYQAANLVVAMAGLLPPAAELKDQIDQWFGKLPKTRKLVRSTVQSVTKPQVEIVTKPDSAQVHLVLGVNGYTMADKRRFPLAVLNRVLGYGLSSRLFMEVREKRGLAYSIYSDYELEVDHGYFAVGAGVNPAKLTEAVKVILAGLAKLKRQLVPEDELQRAKEKVRGPLIFAMENPYYQMEGYAKQALWRPEEIISDDEVIRRVNKVNEKQVQKVAQELFVTNKLNLAIVGPVEQKEKHKLLKLLKV